MPDNDIVPRRIRKPWKPAAELAIGGYPIDQVVDECGKALAAELRDPGAGPAIRELANALEAAVATSQWDVFYAATERFRGSRNTSPLASAVLAEGEHLLESALSGHLDLPHSGGLQTLVDGSLRRFSEGALFGSEEMLKRMHQATGRSTAELDSYKTQILERLPISELANSLAKPDGVVRAPARKARAQTSEMIDEEVF